MKKNTIKSISVGIIFLVMFAVSMMGATAAFKAYANSSNLPTGTQNSSLTLNFTVQPVANLSGEHALENCSIRSIAFFNNFNSTGSLAKYANGSRSNNTYAQENLTYTTVDFVTRIGTTGMFRYNYQVNSSCGTNSTYLFDTDKIIYLQPVSAGLFIDAPYDNQFYSTKTYGSYAINVTGAVGSYNLSIYQTQNDSILRYSGSVTYDAGSDYSSSRRHSFSKTFEITGNSTFFANLTFTNSSAIVSDNKTSIRTIYQGINNSASIPTIGSSTPTPSSYSSGTITYYLWSVDDEKNVTDYSIFYASNINGPYTLNKTIYPVSWTNTTGQNETYATQYTAGIYYWYFLAKDSESNIVRSSIENFTIRSSSENTITNPVNDTTTSSCTGLRVSFNTTNTSTVELRYSQNRALTNLTTNQTGKTFNYDLVGLLPFNTYYYNITACDNVGCIENGTFSTRMGQPLCAGNNYVGIDAGTTTNLSKIASDVGSSYVTSVSLYNNSAFTTYTVGVTANQGEIAIPGYGVLIITTANRTWFGNMNTSTRNITNVITGWNLLAVQNSPKSLFNITQKIAYDFSAISSSPLLNNTNVTALAWYNTSGNQWKTNIVNTTLNNNSIVPIGYAVWVKSRDNTTYLRD